MQIHRTKKLDSSNWATKITLKKSIPGLYAIQMVSALTADVLSLNYVPEKGTKDLVSYEFLYRNSEYFCNQDSFAVFILFVNSDDFHSEHSIFTVEFLCIIFEVKEF